MSLLSQAVFIITIPNLMDSNLNSYFLNGLLSHFVVVLVILFCREESSQGPSPYMRELQSFVLRAVSLYLAPFNHQQIVNERYRSYFFHHKKVQYHTDAQLAIFTLSSGSCNLSQDDYKFKTTITSKRIATSIKMSSQIFYLLMYYKNKGI